ncbi:MAG: hypothetical protein K0S42_1471, partial [Microvirga sp.]|nr:hypothetical protein [Microvirga sp.]
MDWLLQCMQHANPRTIVSTEWACGGRTSCQQGQNSRCC